MTVPTPSQTTAQRCDVVLSPDGSLRIELSGDWIAPSGRWLIEQVFSDTRGHDGPIRLDVSAMRRTTPEVRRLVDGFSAACAEIS